MKRKVLNRAY